MKRQIINISDFNYVVDLYDANTDYSPIVYKQYYIVRNVSFIDNISYDTDIFFIEKDICEELMQLVKNGSSSFSNIVFPCGNNKNGVFSRSFNDFSNLLTEHTFKLESEGGNIFQLFNLTTEYEFEQTNNGWKCISEEERRTFADIKCDKVRIYHPHNKKDLDYIIYFDNIINGIHFHYFCKYNTECESSADIPFIVANKQYSEYIELYIPNIYNLFKEQRHSIDLITKDVELPFNEFLKKNKYLIQDDYIITKTYIDENTNEEVTKNIRKLTIVDKNIYFNDYYNITKYIGVDSYKYNSIKNSITDTEKWISIDSSNISTLFDGKTYKLSYVPFYLIINPFIAQPDGEFFDKVFFKLGVYEANNYNALPLNVTLYPYEISETNNILLINESYIPNSDIFTHDYYFNLISRLGFAHNKLCVINKFKYTNYNNQYEGDEDERLARAYADYNGLTEPVWAYEEKGNIICEDDENYDETKKTFLISKEYIIYKSKRKTLLEDNPDLDIENDYEDTSTINCCGYCIEVYSDHSFTKMIASDYIETPFIENFDFSIVNLFNDWFSVPNTIIINIKFIDRYLGLTIKSGYVILNKEWLKYVFNTKNTTRLLTDMAWTTFDASDSKNTFHFVDKINCIVEKKSDTTESKNKYSNASTKIIYKPIFYRTQDLQNITFKAGLKQKIGINLSAYMTKINSFKLIIDDFEFPEYGRNDIYVIFEVNAVMFTSTAGIYSIVDNDENYLSSGNWYSV